MKMYILPVLLAAGASVSCQAANQLAVKAVNPLPLARPAQTLELSAAQLAPLGQTNLQRIHVKDSSGRGVLCQAVDTDYDAYHRPDIIVFQADFASGETKTFTVSSGAKQVYTRDQFKAHGRFVRERFDDFAWENDRIAHRTYGKALETWAGEPLTSNTIDIWSKRTPRMVVDEWYMVDNYHSDNGEGADFYSAGPSRGCGGDGLWAADKLWAARNFIDSRVLANGPIRLLFELEYAAFDVNGVMVKQTRRITLDAGSQLDHFQSFYQGPATGLVAGIGLKKAKGEQTKFNAAGGWLSKWEPMEKNAGQQGLAIIADPKLIEKQTEDQRNVLLLVKVPAGNAASWWAGFCWDKAGLYTSPEAWNKYVDEFAQSLRAPIEVSVSAE